ncbi:hypothetical protein MC885_015264, partial [Smutsia gigantea]
LHSDQDKGDGSLKYILSGDGAGTLFIIDEKTGDIHATRRIDREEKAFYTLRAQAINRRTLRPVEPESEFVIKIHDINDNEPTFREEIYTASVPEMSVVGTSVVQVTATDADDPSYGNSARVIYSILQGQPYFSVEPETGIIRTALPNMNRESREQYQVVIQAKDMGGQMGGLSGTTTVNITLTDVNDHPPRFLQNTMHLRVLESAPVGTAIGSVKATDADTGKNAEVEYRIIDGDGTDMFDIITEKDTQEGIITVKKEQVTADNPKETTRVAVFVRILDVNDNAPQFAVFYDTFVCENARPGQLIQTISAVDKDDPLGGQKFFFSLAAVNPNFTVQDNEDNDYPIQSSTGTLTIRVCACDSQGNMQSCSAEALLLPAGLSTGALIAILLCIIILLVIVVLFAALKRQRKKEPLILSKEDIRDNIVSYNDEGGGEEDTQAFDIGTLRNPAAMEEKKLRRDIIPETLFIPRRTPTAPDNTDVRDFINERLKEHDLDPTAPPYDSLATYAYEGNDSIAESLSSLESGTTDGDQNYDYLREWGPRFNKLAEIWLSQAWCRLTLLQQLPPALDLPWEDSTRGRYKTSLGKVQPL